MKAVVDQLEENSVALASKHVKDYLADAWGLYNTGLRTGGFRIGEARSLLRNDNKKFNLVVCDVKKKHWRKRVLPGILKMLGDTGKPFYLSFQYGPTDEQGYSTIFIRTSFA